MNNIIISISGLGYVGLPVAIAFDKKNYKIIGYDTNEKRVNELLKNHDITGEVSKKDIEKSDIFFTSNFEDLSIANFHIITVPTPIDSFNKPDLSLIESACAQIGKILKKNDLIIIESTVYPGVTEEIAVPIIEQNSSLKLNIDFSIGYSHERINPADKNYKFESIRK
jgi:UDP-N-acetyl-D-mannosaminuronate dehydrogenase